MMGFLKYSCFSIHEFPTHVTYSEKELKPSISDASWSVPNKVIYQGEFP